MSCYLSSRVLISAFTFPGPCPGMFLCLLWTRLRRASFDIVSSLALQWSSFAYTVFNLGLLPSHFAGDLTQSLLSWVMQVYYLSPHELDNHQHHHMELVRFRYPRQTRRWGPAGPDRASSYDSKGQAPCAASLPIEQARVYRRERNAKVSGELRSGCTLGREGCEVMDASRICKRLLSSPSPGIL